MGALDRLQNYNSKQGVVPREGFTKVVEESVNTTSTLTTENLFSNCNPKEKALFEKIQDVGYKLYRPDENGVMQPTELYNVLTTEGNIRVNSVAGSGKALANGTGVLTPDGFVPIETLKVGDMVAAEDGKFYKVNGVFPQGKKDAYEVKFSDGNSIICSGDHLWNVQSASQRQRERKFGGYRWRTLTTEEISEKCPPRDKSNKRNCYIPMQKAVEFTGKEKLSIDPYLLGVLLGSGYTDASGNTTLRVTIKDKSVIEKITQIIERDYEDMGVEHLTLTTYTLRYYGKHGLCRKGEYVSPLKKQLKKLNLSKINSTSVFIPKEYLFATIEDRLSLLAGILDSDGCWGGSSYDYVTVSEQLGKDLAFLCESLGVTAKLTKKKCGYKDKKTGKSVECKLGYRFYIKPSEVYPKLHRSSRIENQWCETQGYCRRQILEINPLGYQCEMTCISVDSPNHLFLTEHFIPTHNTTALTLKLLHDMETGEIMTLKRIPNGADISVPNKVWVSTFLKTGATELDTALVKMANKLGISAPTSQIVFSTLDAEFKRVLNAMGVATNIAEQSVLKGLLKKAIDVCNITQADGSALTKDDYDIIGNIVNYSRGRLDNKKYLHPSCVDYGLTPTILKLVISQYENLRNQKGVMDFEEIQELLYKFLYITPNPQVQNFIADRYNYIYIDEFQDISQMNYAILKFYSRGKLAINKNSTLLEEKNPLYTGVATQGKLVVVGDISQSIYAFRGADSNILGVEVDKDFEPTVCNLSCNWRCPENILNPVVTSIHRNETSKDQQIYASKKGGEFYPYIFNSYVQMNVQLLKDVKKDIEDGMSVAILVRTNYDGLMPAFMLELSKDFNFKITNSNMSLNSGLPRTIFNMVALINEKTTPSVQSALELVGGRFANYEIKSLMGYMKANSTSIWKIDDDDFAYSCPSLASFVVKMKKILYPGGVRSSASEIETLKAMFKYLITEKFVANTTYSQNGRVFAQSLLLMLESGNYATLVDFIEDYEFIKDKLEGRLKKSSAPIQIATVHEFKGKECDSVYVWNDSVGVFPSKKCDLKEEEQVEEERRVHYIACTRAKKREHIYTLQGQMGMFASEMNCAFTNPIKPTVSI